MVATQLRRRDISDERVLAVMASIPRERFLEPGQRRFAYVDGAAPIAAGQTISQPYVVALMTELLQVEPGDRILEIGTGSGYQAAVLARLGAIVTSIERIPQLAVAAREHLADVGIDGVDVRVGDGSVGAPDGAPWDGIIVTAAAPSVPEALRAQLAVGARLVIPVGPRYEQELLVVERRGPDEWHEWSDGAVAFVPLIGREGFAPPGR